MIELKIALQPKQKAFRESIYDFQINGYGGAKGGGKSHGLRNIMLLRRFEYPNSIGRIFRRTFPELQDNHIDPLFRQFPDLRPYYNESKKTLSLPNGSTLHFNHCQNEKDVFLYQGRETHDLAIDQAEQWTHQMFSILRGSNRSSVPGVPAKTILTFNPGDIGHAWLKRLFITKKYTPNESAGDYNFVQALVDDNAALMDNDPDYVKRLDAEPNEALRKAYRWGDWDIFAGQYFQEINRDIHFIKPFDIPPHWTRFGAYDFGFNHPASFGWYAIDEDGNVYKYRELVKPKMRIDQFAKELKKFKDTKLLYPIVAGHDCWTVRNVLKDEPAPPTIAKQFASYNENDPNDYPITLTKANIDRLQGAAQLRDYIAWKDKPNNRPRFFIFNSCPISFDTIARMIHDPDRVEDVLKVDATESDPHAGDDAYDETRYALMSRPALTEPVKPVIPLYSPAWYQQQSAKDHFQDALDHFQEEKDRELGLYY